MRPIDADAFLKDILTAGIGKTIIEYSESDIGYMIRKRPTIDTVPVVRCRECENHSSSAFYHDLVLCTKHGIYMRTDGFCSFGVRKCNTTRKEGADNEP